VSGDILDVIDGTLRDYAVSGDAMRWSPDPEAREADTDGGASLLLSVDVSGFVEGLRQVCEAIARLGAVCAKAMRPMDLLAALCTGRHERPRDRARCPRCNPRGNPGALAVNGREYQRRLRNRRKRGR
jgi:hypothetical protein